MEIQSMCMECLIAFVLGKYILGYVKREKVIIPWDKQRKRYSYPKTGACSV